MKILFVLTVALVAVQAFDLDTEWEAFKIKYRKNVLTAQEHDARKNIFANNLNFIEKHNAEHALGLHTYTVGVNQFADLTNEEFVEQFTGFKPMEGAAQETATEVIGELPDNIDWRQKGAVTPVKDQGQCGSCWAFSATGTIEGAHFRKTGKLVSLSEQNLIDCDIYNGDGNDGCYGGLPAQALKYVIKKGGICTEESYPYGGYESVCRFNLRVLGATISGVRHIIEGSEEHLIQILGTIGPVSVAIDASRSSFQLYHSGIYNEPYCSSDRLDHAVLAVGYGTENGKDYYIVKNSWGTNWGEEGYIRMSRNSNNQCGIATIGCFAVA